MGNGDASMYGEHVKPALAKLLRTLRLDVRYVRAGGDYLYYRDEGGGEAGVLDLAGGMGATMFGHNHPELIEEKRRCIEEGAPFHAQGSIREECGETARMLSELFPGKEERIVIFTNSGTEAVEAALKHAELNRMRRIEALWKRIYRNHNEVREYCRLHSEVRLPREFAEKGPEEFFACILEQGRMLQELPPVVIAAERSFHGKTTGSVRITGNLMYREAFKRLSGIDARFVEFDSLPALESAVCESFVPVKTLEVSDGRVRVKEEKFLNVCALIIEPVQGEGGIHVASEGYMEGIERLRKKYGFEWILDEIQTGMGRTGKLFALENYSIDPDSVDYVLISKALGGAVSKIGAMMVRKSIHDPHFGILHTSTFAEDAESARMGKKALELLTADGGRLMKEASAKGKNFIGKLKALKEKYPGVVRDARGMGLMIGLELEPQGHNCSLFFRRTSEQGMLGAMLSGYLFHEHRIRTMPPLNTMVSRKPVNIIRIEPSAYITEAEIDSVVSALDKACEIISRSNAFEFSKFIVGAETPGEERVVEDFSKPAKQAAPDPYLESARRMAFLIHPLDIHQVADLFDPSLNKLGRERDPVTGKSQRERYWDRIVALIDSFVFRDVTVRSPRTGDAVNAKFIAFPYTTQQMVELRRERPEELVGGLQKAVDLGAELGASIVGLGAFTSIVTNNGTALDNTFVRITSGNSYTTALVWQSVLKAAEYARLDLGKVTAAVVGAAGNIGSVTASLLAEDIPRLILIGRKRRGALDDLERAAVGIYSDTMDIIRTTKPEDLRGLPRAVAQDLLAPFSVLGSREYRFQEGRINEFIDGNFSGKDRDIGHLLKSLFFVRMDQGIGEKLYEAIRLR
ncbi:MAG: aminotransferase class III-fold pyridoxal phosphate-dependent enzyme, partial [bacterium]